MTAERGASSSPSPIDPERVAQRAESARQLGRFLVTVPPEALDDASRWTGFPPDADTRGAPLARLLSRYHSLLLASATSCHAYRVPAARRRQGAPAPSAEDRPESWPAGYARSTKGRIDVDLTAPGIRENLPFWSGLGERGALCALFTLPLDRVDPAVLFAPGSGPEVATLRRHLPQSAIDFATQEVKRGESVVVAVLNMLHAGHARTDGVELVVFASPDNVTRLAAKAYESGHRPSAEQTISRPFLRGSALFAQAYFLHWDLRSHAAGGGDPEKRLASHLRRVARRPSDWDATRCGVGAAELVAIMEGRGSAAFLAASAAADDDGHDVRIWATDQDALKEETLTFAREVAASLNPAQLVDPTLITPQARDVQTAEWTAALADLVRRLDAVLLSRRVRRRAANARQPTLTRRTLEELARPERWTAMPFYAIEDDVLAVLDFVRDETAASVAVLLEAGELHELSSSWDVRQCLEDNFAGTYDHRDTGSTREIRRGIRLHVWWPDVSPDPIVREPLPSTDDEELVELARALIVDDHGALDPPPFEVVGWGVTDFLLRGNIVHWIQRPAFEGTERLLLQSVYEYPTGKELDRPRYQSPGPWRDVNWTELRRRIKRVRAMMYGALAGGHTAGSRPIPVLHGACALHAEGWQLAGDYGEPGWGKLTE